MSPYDFDEKIFSFIGKNEFRNYVFKGLAGDFKYHLSLKLIEIEKENQSLKQQVAELIQAIKLVQIANNMQNVNGWESLIAKIKESE